MAWSKIKFYWNEALFGLTATSTATGYDVDNLIDRLEGTAWKATGTGDQYITFDAGGGNTYIADYLAISGHNLFSTTATLTLQYSTDNFSGDINDAFTGYTPATDNAIVKEFTSQDKRYWRIKISGTPSAAAEMAISIFGELTELDYATSSYDPYRENVKANINITQGGYVAGIHTKHTERQMRFRFGDAEPALYAKVKAWWDGNGLKNFFIAWEDTNNASDIFLMRSMPRFNNPLTKGGAYRNISIDLRGRME